MQPVAVMIVGPALPQERLPLFGFLGKLTEGVKVVPAATMVVAGVTLAFAILQSMFPELIGLLQRQPTMITGHEYWRFVTALLVQSDGASQLSVNLPLLLVVGTFAEQRWRRAIWVAAYLAGGLTGEIAGIFWQPVGAGNSVAILGVAGLLLAILPQERSLPPLARYVWPAAGLVAAIVLTSIDNIHGPPLFIGALVALTTWRYGRLSLASKDNK
jgi:rhomboid protease GluP